MQIGSFVQRRLFLVFVCVRFLSLDFASHGDFHRR
jgi:hypothetical protein